jgi:cell division protein ZapA
VEQDSTSRQQVKVTILNQSFTLLTTGNPSDMIELANQVDELMNSIARRSPNLDSTRVAVFACLHLADQLRSRGSEPPSVPKEKIIELARMLEDAIG